MGTETSQQCIRAPAGCCREILVEVNRHLLNPVVSIAESIPLGAFGLCAAGQVCRPSTKRDGALTPRSQRQLPPLPAMALSISDQAAFLPRPTRQADFDARNRSR